MKDRTKNNKINVSTMDMILNLTNGINIENNLTKAPIKNQFDILIERIIKRNATQRRS